MECLREVLGNRPDFLGTALLCPPAFPTQCSTETRIQLRLPARRQASFFFLQFPRMQHRSLGFPRVSWLRLGTRWAR